MKFFLPDPKLGFAKREINQNPRIQFVVGCETNVIVSLRCYNTLLRSSPPNVFRNLCLKHQACSWKTIDSENGVEFIKVNDKPQEKQIIKCSEQTSTLWCEGKNESLFVTGESDTNKLRCQSKQNLNFQNTHFYVVLWKCSQLVGFSFFDFSKRADKRTE